MRLIPREEKFFDLFEQQAANNLKGAHLLLKLLEQYSSPDAVYLASKEIHDVEHMGDELVHEAQARLNRSFITPFDREDIYALTCRLDDVMDFVDAVAKRLTNLRIDAPTRHAVEFSRIIVRSSEEVYKGVQLLRNMKQPEALMRQCIVINQLENEADQVMKEALTELFSPERPDPLYVIKWKDIYEHLEVATDKCEDVANVLETVLVKYT